MSTYWDVVCLDCDVESGLHLNHGDDSCRELAQAKIPLAALALANITNLCIGVMGERGAIDLDFYQQHASHVLAAVSEYGHIDGDCNEYRKTGEHTTDGALCRREENHKGEHVYRLANRWEPEWEPIRKAAADRRRTA